MLDSYREDESSVLAWQIATSFFAAIAIMAATLLFITEHSKQPSRQATATHFRKAETRFLPPHKAHTSTSNTEVPAYAALLKNHKTGMSWLVTVQPNSRKMRIQAIGNMIKTPNLRLWIKPAHGTPIMIGKMPMFQQSNSIQLSKRLLSFMSRNADLLVTKGITNPSQHSSLNGHIKLKAHIYHRFNDKRG